MNKILRLMRRGVYPLELAIRFCIRPSGNLDGFIGKLQQWLFYGHLLALELSVVMIWITLMSDYIEGKGFKHEHLGSPSVALFLWLVIFFPIYEEIVFRGWLKHSRYIPVAVLLLLLLEGPGALLTALHEFRAAVALAIIIIFRRRERLKQFAQTVDEALARMLWATVPLSSIAFALVHLNKWEGVSGRLYAIPLLIMPQLLGGVVYSYARMRSGIHVSIALHAGHNLFLFLMLLLAKQFGLE